MKPAIAVHHVTKTYNEGGSSVPALRGVDLQVCSGEIVMLIGPSGSGKTTLLSIMGCILRASSGNVQIAGQEVAHLDESDLPRIRRNHIGFVFQGFNLFPTLSTGENVELMLDVKGVRGPVARERAYEALASVGLEENFNELPANLSGGQKQRVAIARALVGDPGIVLADEPTAALDSHTGRSIMEMLRVLAHERGRAVVIVTHDPRVLEFADRFRCFVKSSSTLLTQPGKEPPFPDRPIAEPSPASSLDKRLAARRASRRDKRDCRRRMAGSARFL